MTPSTLSLNEQTINALKTQLKTQKISTGIWVLDLDSNSTKPLLGPYTTVSAAHRTRDDLPGTVTHEGRYLWCIWEEQSNTFNNRCAQLFEKNCKIDLIIDPLAMEVTTCYIYPEGTDFKVTFVGKNILGGT